MNRRLMTVIAFGGILCLGGCLPTMDTSWSPDGKVVAFAVGENLGLYDPAARQSHALASGEGLVAWPSWSPDGKSIAFYAVTTGQKANVSLRATDVAGEHVRTLVANAWCLPTEVPRGYTSSGESAADAIRDMQGTSLISLMAVAGVTWSPDSKRLACVACSAFDMPRLRPDEGTLLVVDCAAGTATALVKVRAGLVAAPRWSPDGRRVAFVHVPWAWIDYLGERPEATKPLRIPERESLRLYDVETATVSRICDLPGEGRAPCTRLEWSADSRRIGLITLDSGPTGLATAWTVPAATGATPKPAATGISAAATWGRDLAGLAFLEDRDGEVVLIYRGLHPATRRALTAFPSSVMVSPGSDVEVPYSLPDLSPDGRRIVLRVPQTLDPSGILVLDLTRNSKTPGG